MTSKVKIMVDGGKASPAPPIGPALGPLGLNIGQVVAKINEKTASFSGMKVPVIVVVGKNKQFEIEVGLPPTAALIKKELGLEKGAKTSGTEVVGNFSLVQAVSIAKVKLDGSFAKDIKAAVKEVLGTCVSLGVTVEGKDAREVQQEITEGKHDQELK